MSYNEDRARRATRNAITRARKHLANDRTDAAVHALASGAKTAQSWLDSTHPKAK